jgi:hypothetical protein
MRNKQGPRPRTRLCSTELARPDWRFGFRFAVILLDCSFREFRANVAVISTDRFCIARQCPQVAVLRELIGADCSS